MRYGNTIKMKFQKVERSGVNYCYYTSRCHEYELVEFTDWVSDNFDSIKFSHYVVRGIPSIWLEVTPVTPDGEILFNLKYDIA